MGKRLEVMQDFGGRSCPNSKPWRDQSIKMTIANEPAA